MHAGFFGLRGPPNVCGSIFRGSGQNFTIGPSFWEFSKIVVKIDKNFKIYREIFRKMQNFTKNFTKIENFSISLSKTSII